MAAGHHHRSIVWQVNCSVSALICDVMLSKKKKRLIQWALIILIRIMLKEYALVLTLPSC